MRLDKKFVFDPKLTLSISKYLTPYKDLTARNIPNQIYIRLDIEL